MNIRVATSIGAGAIALWSSLAGLTAIAAPPPFFACAVAFSIAAGLGIAKCLWRGGSVVAPVRQRPKVWALGLYGLFGYHAAYFAALALAPPVEANLLNYLWPLLIVLFAGLLPGERLRWFHLAGAALGLAGCVLVVGAGAGASGFEASQLWGYGFAFAAAIIWSSYSVLSRRFGDVPTDAVTAFCAGTALLAALCHLIFESAYTGTAAQWAALIGMGFGPVGLAFYLWDVGMKKGDIKALGAASYLTPILSTGLLVIAGGGHATLTLAIACALVVGGAVLASKDVIFKR
ncbi:MAG: EamA family transporter [Alphaproteobacteria bacterium]|nr:EamA family transporter [Alphaproteobacteria bacterium]